MVFQSKMLKIENKHVNIYPLRVSNADNIFVPILRTLLITDGTRRAIDVLRCYKTGK